MRSRLRRQPQVRVVMSLVVLVGALAYLAPRAAAAVLPGAATPQARSEGRAGATGTRATVAVRKTVRAPAPPTPVAPATAPRPPSVAAPPPPPPQSPPPPPPPAGAGGIDASSTESPACDLSCIGSAALARLDYPYQRLGYTISFVAPRPGFLGMTWCSSHQIDVYVRPDESVGLVSFIAAFEMAHAVDCTYNTAATRAQWASIRGFDPATAWFPPCSCSEDSYGSGDFADVFATWLAGSGWWQWRSNLAPAPSSAELAQLQALLEPPALKA